MKTQSTFKQIFTLTVTLLLITAGVAAALAGVNAVTAPIIERLNAEKTTKAIAAVLSDAQTAEQTYTAAAKEDAVQAVWTSETGYAVKVQTGGFGGTITMMVGIDKNGAVLGIDIISHAETASLGDVAASKNAKGEAFRGQYVGKTGPLAVSKDGGTIDAITSATITSRAVTTGVNTALEFIKTMG